MIAVCPVQACHGSQAAHGPELLHRPDLALPWLMCRTGANVHCDLVGVEVKISGHLLVDLSLHLPETGHHGAPGSHRNTVVPSGLIIDPPKA